MAVRNMGRIQGASMFYAGSSLGATDAVISSSDIYCGELKPFVNDTVVDVDGELFMIVGINGEELTLKHQGVFGSNIYMQLDIIDGNLCAYTNDHRVQDFVLQNGKLYLEAEDG